MLGLITARPDSWGLSAHPSLIGMEKWLEKRSIHTVSPAQRIFTGDQLYSISARPKQQHLLSLMLISTFTNALLKSKVGVKGQLNDLDAVLKQL